jgi:outer membrane biosynthesis protein TonB
VLPTFRSRVRAFLGLNALPRMESTMTSMLTLLQGLSAQTSEASAAQQASFLNLHNGLDRLSQNVRDLQEQVANGDVSPEVQALATQLSENLTTIKKAAETADDGFEPVEVPGDDEPTDPGTPATPEVPAEPEVPVVDEPAPAEDVPAEPETPTENVAKRGR